MQKTSPTATIPSFQLQSSLDVERAKVEGQEFELVKQEILFDERSWEVYQRKVSEYDLRTLHLKDDWLHKRYDIVKNAANAFIEQKVSLFSFPDKFTPGTALEVARHEQGF